MEGGGPARRLLASNRCLQSSWNEFMVNDYCWIDVAPYMLPWSMGINTSHRLKFSNHPTVGLKYIPLTSFHELTPERVCVTFTCKRSQHYTWGKLSYPKTIYLVFLSQDL